MGLRELFVSRPDAAQVVLKRGEKLWRAGDQAADAFWVEYGLVLVRRRVSRDRVVSAAGAGSLVGFRYLKDPPLRRDDDAEAAAPTAVWRMDALDLRRQADSDPGLLRELLGIREAAVARLETDLAYAGETLKTRLLRALAVLAEELPSAGGVVTAPLAHGDLAGMAGATRESTCIAMSELAAGGLLAQQRCRVVFVPETVQGGLQRRMQEGEGVDDGR